jgi:hypothetical protein
MRLIRGIIPVVELDVSDDFFSFFVCCVMFIDWGFEGMWTLDPIDGTKGFLRGGQYAVCLALIENAQVQLGVMGCPNLLVDPLNQNGPKGCIFVAVRGQGAQQVQMLFPLVSFFVCVFY